MTSHANAAVLDIPPASGRWTVARKEAVVAAVEAGADLLTTLADHRITLEEFMDWKSRLSRRGQNGLKQRYIGERLHG